MRVTIWAGEELADAARHHAPWIKGEVLAEEWNVEAGEPPDAAVAHLDIDGSTASVRLDKVAPPG